MWLSNSSVGRKFIMAITGAVLVLFVTFHCLMNAVAIFRPTAYNMVCEFLGANWYALVASAGLALFILIHIIYAVMLTVHNRGARGSQRYLISKRPASVEWSSQNMLVLGLVILAFLVVHLIQFWAKMQLEEVLGKTGLIPAAAGTLFLQEAFAQPWTLIVYAIGFIALWFHLNHGMWSMFQSAGWNNTIWMPRLKKIALWWTSIIVVIFFAEGIVFTIKANQKYYLTNQELRNQYITMLPEALSEDFGQNTANYALQAEVLDFDSFESTINSQLNQYRQILPNVEMQLNAGQNELDGLIKARDAVKTQTPNDKAQIEFLNERIDGLSENLEMQRKQYAQAVADSTGFSKIIKFCDFIHAADKNNDNDTKTGK